MQLLIPMYYYPVKVLFVDDDLNLLMAYQHFHLPNQIETISNPKQALEAIIASQANKLNLFKDITEEAQIDLAQSNPDTIIGFAYKSLNKIIDSQTKYNQYGILITDYQMPEMNGLELCDQLANYDIRKILLTGAYSTTNAVSALNNKEIDYFMPKSELTAESLTMCIHQLQLRHFYKITENFLSITGNKLTCFTNPDFANLINNFVQQNNISEYYLLNHTGCYLLKNEKDKFILNIYTEEDLEQFCNMYSHIDPELLYNVQQHNLIPHYELPKQEEITQAYFYPAQQLGIYYYNFVKV